ncbi:butyrophilin subfamily 3 member A1-like [Rhinichthys klamathensis goyatoka]|uniref:SPRY_PRY_C-I_1 domain-containing protein n=1 Tax=Rhinichthys klamathensis goyatoka TaxID=3034132 RepID=UPI0024B4958F|nr:SPRY_PRY_C-I_1 domain-containing protein [Rhinichthys klamathensis goyatoka]XP_056116686.1 butyrophilin subfamily 3 member A1-like [Rhinichthys klamathensis goyatoka]
MAFAAAAGVAFSDVSLMKPNIKKNERASASFPGIRPDLSAAENVVKIFKQFGKDCYQRFNFKIPATESIQQKDNSLDESRDIIRNLASELDRVVQSKMFYLMTQKFKNKGTKKEEPDEQQYYILQWAEDLENTQTKQLDKQEIQHTCSEQLSNSEIKFNKAKKILSDWSWELKDMEQNSIFPKRECEETLRDLHKEWKQGESSILPVMDWIIWTVLQSGSSEDSNHRQWVKRKQSKTQNAKNAVGLCIPNPVWNWITKSTAVVILDPNTANPDLLVSKDGKSLRAKEYGLNNWKEFQRKRSKFDAWTCVQAKEGYNTGRHYWEVNVKKKHEWRVGVVKESAPRSGYVTMNTKTGYWNLHLRVGTLMALTEPVIKLNLPTPSKIGVYLDIEEGHVSFYDAEKRRHIYTFNTDFSETENIYPMFGTIETDRALVISS